MLETVCKSNAIERLLVDFNFSSRISPHIACRQLRPASAWGDHLWPAGASSTNLDNGAGCIGADPVAEA
jgi:hypothetical protein